MSKDLKRTLEVGVIMVFGYLLPLSALVLGLSWLVEQVSA